MKKLHLVIELDENEFIYFRDSAVIEKMSISKFMSKYFKEIFKINGGIPNYEKVFKK